MPELWFFLGVAVGTIVTGFAAIGSFARGSDSVRRVAWQVEHAARKRALVASRAVVQIADEPAPQQAAPSAGQLEPAPLTTAVAS